MLGKEVGLLKEENKKLESQLEKLSALETEKDSIKELFE